MEYVHRDVISKQFVTEVTPIPDFLVLPLELDNSWWLLVFLDK